MREADGPIEEYLAAVASIWNPSKVLSVEKVLLLIGKKYEWSAYPEGVWRGRPRYCYQDSHRLSQMEDLIYVEGYAMLHSLGLPLPHAWCVDGSGRVFDPTWNEPASYLGVEFSAAEAAKRLLEKKTYGLFYDHPVRGDTFLSDLLESRRANVCTSQGERHESRYPVPHLPQLEQGHVRS